jgi:CRISPR system Cascade subunit CasE
MSAAPADAAPGIENAADLNMLRLPLDVRRLMQFGRAYRLLGRGDAQDDGYLAHALFAALFGADAPKPFALPTPGERRPGEAGIMPVLAYTPFSLATLRTGACAVADPDIYEVVRWDEAGDKPMPAFMQGGYFGFELRACPLRRLGRGATARAGAEIDIYQAEKLAAKNPDDVPPRADIYAMWLKAQFAAAGGVQLLDIRMLAFRRSALMRRGREQADKSRPLQRLERPDAHFGGMLQITDPGAFRRFLARGVGRHRAFGFGMLLLRRLATGA